MSEKHQLFRKTSLDRLSSPEQLDALMQVTSPKGWVALLAIGGLLFMALLWGVWGSIPTRIMGTCILIDQAGISLAAWSFSGSFFLGKWKLLEMPKILRERLQIMTRAFFSG